MLFLYFLIGLIRTVLAVEYGAVGANDNIGDLKEAFEKANDDSLLWGPYRSNIYVGVKPRVPRSLITGLIWYKGDNYRDIISARHNCDGHDGMDTFGWMEYDPRLGGRELIDDSKGDFNMTVDFVKSEDGKNWAMHIVGTPYKENQIMTIAFYTAMGSLGKMEFETPMETRELVSSHNVTFSGDCPSIGGPFTMELTESSSNEHPALRVLKEDWNDPSKTHMLSAYFNDRKQTEARDIYLSILNQNLQVIEHQEQLVHIPAEELLQLKNIFPDGLANINTFFVQKTFTGKFEFTLTFNLDDTKEQLTPENFDAKFTTALAKFRDKFRSKLQLSTPFNGDKYVKFAKEFLSQLMGGIIYQYGTQMVDRTTKLDEVGVTLEGKPEGPYELFSLVPSRTTFPRGFYWDEGFHLIPILSYDSDLALDIVKSWLSLIDEDGWIAREQILGTESRARVPEEFVTQNPNIANPPTIMMVFHQLLHLANHIKDNSIETGDDEFTGDLQLGDVQLKNAELLNSYAEEIYPKLQLHYEWFRHTQRGETEELDRSCKYPQEVYRWKGRDENLCLPSGLDDYPRCVADIAELDVDLLSWMGVMSKTMAGIATLLDKQEDAKLYETRLAEIKSNLEELHWSESDQSYCDITVDDYEDDTPACHIGYVTLMPFFHRLIAPDSPHLLPVLETLADPEQLWSPYGIRSLSKQDENFHEGEDYWRGNIWMNMNYLALDALRYYGGNAETNPDARTLAAQLYTNLRKNIVNTIFDQYEKTGYAWETYDEATGAGRRGNAFLGWSSLVVPILAMPENI